MALYLNRDDFQTGGVWADFTGPRAWVAQFVFPGGTGTYACSTHGLARLPERIVFRIENEQVDEVHKSWTFPRENGMRAFEHFLLHGERHPRLKWQSSRATCGSRPNHPLQRITGTLRLTQVHSSPGTAAAELGCSGGARRSDRPKQPRINRR
jgi:hypothetical protein